MLVVLVVVGVVVGGWCAAESVCLSVHLQYFADDDLSVVQVRLSW